MGVRRSSNQSSTDQQVTNQQATDPQSGQRTRSAWKNYWKPKWKWQLLPTWETFFKQLPLENFHEWLHETNLPVIKQGKKCSVYRARVADQSLVIKHFHYSGWKSLTHSWMKSNPSRHEWETAEELLQRGIHTFQPIALGEVFQSGKLNQSVLISLEIENAFSLEEYLFRRLKQLPTKRAQQRREELIPPLANFCGQLHEAGVYQADFHLGNILLQPQQVNLETRCEDAHKTNNDNTFRWHLMDLAKVELESSLNWERSRENLAILNACLFQEFSQAERWEFWKAYLQSRNGFDLSTSNTPSIKVAAQQIEVRTQAINASTARHRDRRSLAVNRHFYLYENADFTAHVVRQLPVDELERLLKQLSNSSTETFSEEQLETVSGTNSEPSNEQFSTSPFGFDTRQTTVKLQLETEIAFGVIHQEATITTDRLRGFDSYSQQHWHHSQSLLLRSLPTLRTFAMIELKSKQAKSKTNHSRSNHFLVTQPYQQMISLSELIHRSAFVSPTQASEFLQTVCFEVGKSLGKLHHWELRLPPLSANHFLTNLQRRTNTHTKNSTQLDAFFASTSTERFKVKLFLTDLRELQITTSLSAEQRLQDLSVMMKSFGSILQDSILHERQMLQGYLVGSDAASSNWKVLHHQLIQLSK